MDGRAFCLRTAHMVALRQECASWLNNRVSGEGEDLAKGSEGISAQRTNGDQNIWGHYWILLGITLGSP